MVEQITESDKAVQFIRVVDVLILGPVLIFIGIKYNSLPMWIRIFLIISGIATILFNATRFIKKSRN